MAQRNLVLIRHSSTMRHIGENEARDALNAEERSQVRHDVHVDTSSFDVEIDGGDWDGSHRYLRETAGAVRARAADLDGAEFRYFGLAEIPHIIALGSYIGDEYHVRVQDFDYTANVWAWPQIGRTLKVGTTQVPKGTAETPLPRDVVHAPGNIVLRIAVSAPITDEQVEAAIGKDRLADVLIFPEDVAPAPGLIRSWEDVISVRMAFREAMSASLTARPNADAIHLFVAAPPSVCFVIGQELRLRSGLDVQTYRYRTAADQGPYTDAILLTARELSDREEPLSEEELARVAEIRQRILPATLEGIKQYAASKQEDAAGSERRWFEYLQPREVLTAARPFPSLPPIWEVVGPRQERAGEFRSEAYGRDKDSDAWRWSDATLIGLDRAAGGDDARLSDLLRLFWFHEYLHDWQSLTKYSAEDVGSFANCLERIDYIADLYAILHQLDYTMRAQRARVTDEPAQLAFLADQIDLAIRSFWVFNPHPPQTRWQERRLRRYLNWFWRRVQVLRARDLPENKMRSALATLRRQPTIELAGLPFRLAGARIEVMLDRRRVGEPLLIGLVLETEKFQRLGSAGNMSLEALVDAFINHDHDEVQLFFNSLFENLPRAEVFAGS